MLKTGDQEKSLIKSQPCQKLSFLASGRVFKMIDFIHFQTAKTQIPHYMVRFPLMALQQCIHVTVDTHSMVCHRELVVRLVEDGVIPHPLVVNMIICQDFLTW